jgi:hypothetical protein
VCAQAGLVGFDLWLAVRDQFGGFIAERSVVEEWQRLREANRLLFDEMLNKPLGQSCGQARLNRRSGG